MFEILLGHLVGDFLLQNNWLATNKTKYNGLGWATCLIHCYLYTIAVSLFTQNIDVLWIIIVFLSHFIIDKFGIPEKYLKMINGRSLERFINDPENAAYSPYIGLRAGFYILVYTVVDNTMHLVLMYLGWKLLYS